MTDNLTTDELRETIVHHEWNQFQHTNNEGGRAACQAIGRFSTRCVWLSSLRGSARCSPATPLI